MIFNNIFSVMDRHIAADGIAPSAFFGSYISGVSRGVVRTEREREIEQFSSKTIHSCSNKF